MLRSKQKIASGNILAIFGGSGIVLSMITLSGSDNPAIIALLFLAGITAGLGATLAVPGLFGRK